ncbi:VWA-like domain-containing protein [Desulfosporosinus sp. FKA]|uniref:vWA domain-containing protein n=1 Tax=Desulfosporosinus sp. FKA TaxID=1969834 RepID=UPI001FA92B44|nr:VWA-like domain-containing protein [Desulfosporosinus sp. FKA]
MIFPLELQAARIRLVKERPYLASAAWALRPIPKRGLKTMAVDMYWRLYYDPSGLSQWPVEVIEGALYHEICHLLRNHSERMKGFNPRLSNIATDAEINDDLIREGVKFPAQPVTPDHIGQPESLLAEEYYAVLEKQEQLPLVYQKKNQTSGSPVLNSSPRPGSGLSGSCATGQMASWEDQPPSKGSSSGVSLTEGDLIRRSVAQQIREHARSQGSVPGHWHRWAEDKLQPKVDWRKQLAAAIRFAAADTTGATDYSYCRPSRRHGLMGKGNVIFPSLRCPLPSVAVVADTSGSMSEKMLSQALAEISGILRFLAQKEKIYVLAVDQTVEFCRRVFRPEQIQLTGGGGTDMRVGLEAAARLKPLPQLGIVITDGQTPWPDHPPQRMKVIVILFGDGTVPDWAKVIHIRA